MKKHRNIKYLVEAILTKSTKVDACKFLEIVNDQIFNKYVFELMGLKGGIDEMKEALITTAKENPDSELANVIRIISPEILPQKVEQAPQIYPECGYMMKTSSPFITKPNSSNGLPFLASQNYLRAKGRI
jgi:hypothetical protein